MRAKGGGELAFKAGQTIIAEGDPGREMFIVEEGRVEIFRAVGGEERRISLLEYGDFFGEMSLIDDLPRNASARAQSDCRILAIDHATFDQILRQYPEVAIRMLRKMGARLRELEAAMESQQHVVQDAPVVLRKASSSEVPPVRAAAPAAPTPPPPPAAPVQAPPPPPVAAAPPAPPAAPPAPAGVPSYRLVLFESGTDLPLPNKSDIRVGRFDSVTNTSPDIDLTEVDSHKTTSRRHAKLMVEDGRVYVFEEIGTSNGTFVNGLRVSTGVKVEVKDGDWVQFGGVKTILRRA